MTKSAEVELEAVKNDVRALRDALEAAGREAAAAERRTDAERSREIGELQATIASLRDEMIRQREQLLATVHATERDGAAQADELRAAIVAARRHADELQQHHDSVLADQTQRFESERRELHDTISELRRRLELATAGDRR